jgi:hypothetical protein
MEGAGPDFGSGLRHGPCDPFAYFARSLVGVSERKDRGGGVLLADKIL